MNFFDMNILLTNDDGYQAKGIWALANRLKEKHNVVMVAPDSERSGASHHVNFYGGITYKAHGFIDGVETFSVSGSPADCVIFSVRHLLKDKKIDCVISGINSVLNVGTDVIYSGTVGAAQEGTFQGLPSIAVSLRTRRTEDYEFSADWIFENLDELLKFASNQNTVNVNIPCVKKEDIKGVRVAPIMYRPYEESYVNREGFSKDIYFVDGRPIRHTEAQAHGDCYLVENGYIVISPIPLVANDFEAIEEMKKADFKL